MFCFTLCTPHGPTKIWLGPSPALAATESSAYQGRYWYKWGCHRLGEKEKWSSAFQGDG